MTLLIAAAVMAVEGVTALVLGGYVGVETVVGAPEVLSTSIAVAVFGLAVGAGLLWVAWGLFTEERWSRAPSVVTQIILVPVAVTLIDSGRLDLGIPLVVIALAALVALLAPRTTHALYGDDAEHPS
ncbi:hypothetical protein Misp01_14250 [Microtetraspora sp. NBRC 13810]|uniref:hypothetical protein n=1 Tax=Microtetraspora sp. NBRC 13810 TaxID=3030990 RepID=UPI0024A0CAEF|nr:hypothetical protein [Microtetraspora sp. NBRC 13810]GLW06295.1 hypothetical protein Misp01_14250 [Microtetraspora sp. NBRC 13810]